MFENYLFFGMLGMIVGCLFVIVKRLNEVSDILQFIKHQDMLNTLFKSLDKASEDFKTKVKAIKVEDEKDRSGTAA